MHAGRASDVELDDAVRRHQGMYEPFANMAPNSRWFSSSIPSEKSRVLGSPLLPPTPNSLDQKSAWRLPLADSDRDRPAQLPTRRVEGVDLATQITEQASVALITSASGSADRPAELIERQ